MDSQLMDSVREGGKRRLMNELITKNQ